MASSRIHRLTDAHTRNLKPQAKDYTHSDGGRLYIYVRPYGGKEWFFRFTSPITQKRRKASLGRYPDTTLQDARKAAAQRRAMLDGKLDPLIEDEKANWERAKEHSAAKEKEKRTVKAVFEQWKRAELQNRKDGGVEAERAFEKDVFPVIGSKPVSEITRQDIKSVLDRPLGRKSNRMANRLLSDLKQFFGYIQDEELTDKDPTRRMFKNRVGGIERPRKRFLSEHERKLLFVQLPTSDLAQNYQHAIWIMLATGCRVDEISRARWSDIDFKKRIFTIPTEHAKNGEQHEVHLSNFALAHFESLHHGKNSKWIFPDRKGDDSIHRQTISKQITDRQRDKPLRGRTKKNDSLKLPGGRWTAHDMRRTGATIMQELGIMPHIVKKCLNQRLDDPIIETYQRAQLVEMKTEAFDKLGAYLSTLEKKYYPCKNISVN